VDLITGMNKYGEEVPYQYRIYQGPHCMDLEAMKPSEMNNRIEEKHADWVCYTAKVGQAPGVLPYEKNNIVILLVGENISSCPSSNFQE
jgi:hypothetical protein